MRFRNRMSGLAGIMLGLASVQAWGGDPSPRAEFAVTTNMLRAADEIKPLGANCWGGGGSVEWAANNIIRNSGNEPIVWRNLHRATSCGTNWFTIDPGTSWWDCWNSGFLSGSSLRIYRLVDKEGKPIPPGPDNHYPDMSTADHVIVVGKGQVIPEGTPGFPDGGWLATSYARLHPFGQVSAETRSVKDLSVEAPGHEYWYVVLAVGDNDKESDPSAEVNATPLLCTNAPPAHYGKEDASLPPKREGGEKPMPPRNVRAVAGPGQVTLSWDASPSDHVVAYRVKRSSLPSARQVNRVYVTPETPALLPWDYIVLERRFDPVTPFKMSYVNPRIRGMGNPMFAPDWYWTCQDDMKPEFALWPYGPKEALDNTDKGQTCLQVKAIPGSQTIFQYAFIGTNKDGALWYGQLEPDKTYRLEAWFRQDGLAGNGEVTFSLGRGYPEVKHAFSVTGDWKRYTFDFTAGPRPGDVMHFGPNFEFKGPGTLWMDNARLFRCDQPEELEKPYVPNATVLQELVRSQPATGRKGAHRIWFLDRDATMESLTSWHANSKISVNWRTTVDETMIMTLPMGLTFDLATGSSAKDRMRPWLVLQHMVHSEADWLGLVEYLAAPYDPARDTPKSKPWAYKRIVQRGTNVPWTDEFEEIIIELGNETWHNGAFPDWLGFGPYNAIHQGGHEYGLFTRYLCETMMQSPYWKARGLDRKIRFALGANYETWIGDDGKVGGYGELAMQANPYASILGHANYVGPKWETGDYNNRQYNNEGLQECLVSYLTGTEPGEIKMGKSRDALKAVHPYALAAYEGGPGGYSLPWSAKKEQVEIDESYGKSLAQGVGALDCWLGSYKYGWCDQCFLGYNEGTFWTSHTTLADGFRPTPAWQALTLRNRYAAGDLMAVDTISVPLLAKGKQSFPLIGTYAMRDGRNWSVFVLSRKLAGQHNGADFGTGETPVALDLPFKRARTVTLHTLSGDPKLTNRERLNIQPQSQVLPADVVRDGHLVVDARSGGQPGGIPAGSIYLYVFGDVTAK